MSKQTAQRRPAGATGVAVVTAFGAAFYLLLGLWLAFFDVPVIAPVNSVLKPLPEWVPLVNGLMSLTLGLLYVILLRMILGRTNSAYPMVQSIALINFAFGLFRLPAGAITIAISVLIVILSNSESAKAWLRSEDS